MAGGGQKPLEGLPAPAPSVPALFLLGVRAMAGSPAVPEQAQSSRRAYTPAYIDSKRPGVLLEYSEKIAYGLCAVCGSAPAVNLVNSKLGFSGTKAPD